MKRVNFGCAMISNFGGITLSNIDSRKGKISGIKREKNLGVRISQIAGVNFG